MEETGERAAGAIILLMTDERPKHLDIFSGIGGFALAAQWVGFRTVAFCESDARCRDFLGKRWGLPVVPDVRELDGRQYSGVSLLSGGPPCTPASRAGKQRGAGDDRWLWDEALRVLEEAKPDSVVFENPPGILDVGIDGILSEMGRLGYETGCFDIPACAVDSPQLRHRIWIVGFLADSAEPGREGRDAERAPDGRGAECTQSLMADTEVIGGRSGLREARPEQNGHLPPNCDSHWQNSVWVPCADNKLHRAPDDSFGVVDGLHRSLLGALGNSVVPQVAYQILKAVREQI